MDPYETYDDIGQFIGDIVKEFKKPNFNIKKLQEQIAKLCKNSKTNANDQKQLIELCTLCEHTELEQHHLPAAASIIATCRRECIKAVITHAQSDFAHELIEDSLCAPETIQNFFKDLELISALSDEDQSEDYEIWKTLIERAPGDSIRKLNYKEYAVARFYHCYTEGKIKRSNADFVKHLIHDGTERKCNFPLSYLFQALEEQGESKLITMILDELFSLYLAKQSDELLAFLSIDGNILKQYCHQTSGINKKNKKKCFLEILEFSQGKESPWPPISSKPHNPTAEAFTRIKDGEAGIEDYEQLALCKQLGELTNPQWDSLAELLATQLEQEGRITLSHHALRRLLIAILFFPNSYTEDFFYDAWENCPEYIQALVNYAYFCDKPQLREKIYYRLKECIRQRKALYLTCPTEQLYASILSYLFRLAADYDDLNEETYVTLLSDNGKTLSMSQDILNILDGYKLSSIAVSLFHFIATKLLDQRKAYDAEKATHEIASNINISTKSLQHLLISDTKLSIVQKYRVRKLILQANYRALN